ncbi:uncharacterized protein LOC144001189 isoform X2 [Festucalex cinctus]
MQSQRRAIDRRHGVPLQQPSPPLTSRFFKGTAGRLKYKYAVALAEQMEEDVGIIGLFSSMRPSVPHYVCVSTDKQLMEAELREPDDDCDLRGSKIMADPASDFPQRSFMTDGRAVPKSEDE